ncbi:hypothetical protein CAEBREN_29980 [Caenorhabditis brenneri]|uniref:Protein kinase domain-containing protein n=1 Tax=Caenorhabditis brenneri TaxID=135651 RepID=G0PKR5_CAEBE|nr:hypothetical protein CAEBREN_29980 [Caenorhabditis brenneri]
MNPQEAYEMPADNKKVMLKIDDVHLHSCGVFSNVYKGMLREPYEKKVAIKKSWPEKGERNFEFIFLTGRERSKHKNVIQMIFAFSHSYDTKVCESYVFDYMPNTLAEVIRQKLTDIDIRLYTWQIFAGLKYLEEHKVVHRDLKPVNILVDHDTAFLKISDFGSAKIIVKGKSNNFYQVTRFYRPPELLLKSMDYNSTVGYWMYSRRDDQTSRGIPWKRQCSSDETLLSLFRSPKRSRNQGNERRKTGSGAMEVHQRSRTSKSERACNKRTLLFLFQLVTEITPDQLQFLKRILVYSPEKRLRGKQLLQDDFFRPLFKNGSVRHNGQKISEVITAADYKRASENEDATACRLAQLATKTDSKDQGIPNCEKSNSYENVAVRRSTLIPKEQKMAREIKSREDNSDDRRLGSSEDPGKRSDPNNNVTAKKSMMKSLMQFTTRHQD